MPLPTAGQPTAAAIGKGTTLGYTNQASGGTYVTVAELLDLKMPTHEGETLPVQRYDSTSLYPELIASWMKAGTVDLKLTYNAAQGAALFALLLVLTQWKVTKPDASTWVYSGMITKFGDEIPLKDKMQNIVTFSISGAPVPSSASA